MRYVNERAKARANKREWKSFWVSLMLLAILTIFLIFSRNFVIFVFPNVYFSDGVCQYVEYSEPLSCDEALKGKYNGHQIAPEHLRSIERPTFL